MVGMVVSLGVAALIVGAIREGRERAAVRTLGVLPSTASAVLHVDLVRLAKGIADPEMLGGLAGDERWSDIEDACGLDPLTDLREITVWVRGPDDRPFESFGLMLEGRTVGASELAACHRQLVERRGDTVVRIEAPSGPLLSSPDRSSAIGVLDSSTVVTGSARTVAEALAAHRGLVPTLKERARLTELWRSVGRDVAVTAVVEPPTHWRAALERIGSLGDDDSALDGVVAIGLGAITRKKLDVHLIADFGTEPKAIASAQRIAAWASEPPSLGAPWDEVLRSGRVSTDRTRVDAVWSLRALRTAP